MVHPSKTAKSGKFDCTTMSLSLLLDYRPEDTKEHSFEVSLFAELFNEMLMRDFGFNIFKALYELPEKVKEKEDKKKKDEEKKTDDEKRKDDDKRRSEKERSEEKDKKQDERKTDDKKSNNSNKKDERKTETNEDSDEDDDYDDEEARDKKKDRKKKDRPKLYTKDKQLLLSFIYFDQTHCGYIFEKDIEDLLYTLGLRLSRAQVRKLVSKVITRDSLHYRKLTDKSRDEDFIVIDDSEKEILLHDIAVGNKNLLPVFTCEEVNKKREVHAAHENNGAEDGKCKNCSLLIFAFLNFFQFFFCRYGNVQRCVGGHRKVDVSVGKKRESENGHRSLYDGSKKRKHQINRKEHEIQHYH